MGAANIFCLSAKLKTMLWYVRVGCCNKESIWRRSRRSLWIVVCPRRRRRRRRRVPVDAWSHGRTRRSCALPATVARPSPPTHRPYH